ncbi:L-serine ammonia-lyase, iron-sulfur-dependent, subunit alpha [Lagierella sp. ICN-221743]
MIYYTDELLKYSEENDTYLWELVLEDELEVSNDTKEGIYEKLSEMLAVMEKSANKYLDEYSETGFGLIDGYAKETNEYVKKRNTMLGEKNVRTMAMAFSTLELSSSMGKIVASPTAGSSGIIPAIIARYRMDDPDVSDEKLIEGLLTAVGVGKIIGRFANFSGAEGGCQAECGSAAAMASAALVYLKGGDLEQSLNAASIAVVNILGLVCDPVAGLVEYPCTFRNASGAINAILSADLALAGIKSLVPFEEVCQALNDVGESMSFRLKETALGGIAATRTGERIKKEFYEKHNQ